MENNKTILIVDDDTSIINIMSLILRNAGYNVSTNGNGDLHFLQDHIYPDLILLDNELGSKNGAEICRHLKDNPLTQHIPIMLVSATEGLAQISVHAGANDFLPKPFDVETLLLKVASLFGKGQP